MMVDDLQQTRGQYWERVWLSLVAVLLALLVGAVVILWAERIGENTAIVVKGFLSAHRVEQQGYKSCMALLELSDKYSVIRLEAACKKALTYTPKVSLKNVRTILQTGMDKVEPEIAVTTDPSIDDEFGFTRGSSYYGRGK